ncbi:alpha-L-fucosidase [Pontiella sulfatireligans]|uniref:alpha-L-fucosidase n=1 Tax=Pontiella sulfatireligans TaxID=2750658 RepID=A0A6C2UES8_9BACT|nr:alpha-L-fucosidase [Pontiella sulfatireligans]VGO18037.1 hypothetical protein SCARR_00087 [Pontiella sulfatireligans]
MKKYIVSVRSLLFVAMVGTVNAAEKKSHNAELHDAGTEVVYTAPAAHLDYLKKVDPSLVPSLRANPEALEEWQDDRFGIFVHWDHSSQVKASMSWGRGGAKPHHSRDGEQKGVPEEEYNKLAYTFNPTQFNADEWADLFAASGAKYVVFTAKHHAGFSMFDSAVTDFDIMSSPFKRDVCKELSAALHARGLKVGWYFSQPDWYEPRYREELPSQRFNDEFLFPQIRELLTHYGKIDILWFDGLGKHPDTWDSPRLLNMVRELQPHIVTNHRFAPRSYRMGDFDGPERQTGRFQTNRPWETCTVIGGKWGYGGESHPMSLQDSVALLVRCAGNGGNLLLNTGPRPTGEIIPEHAQRYREIGAWLKENGESIYATRGGPYKPGPWGCATRSKDGKTVYLHVLGKIVGNVLQLPALPAKIVEVQRLNGKPVKAAQKNGQLMVVVPTSSRDELDTVIALRLNQSIAEVPPIDTVRESLTVGAAVTSSSNKKEPASVIVASDATEFSEGIFVKSAWGPDKSDKTPWVKIAFKDAQSVQSLEIRQGKYGSLVRSDMGYTVEVRQNGDWKEVCKGDRLNIETGIVLKEPVVCDAIRFSFDSPSVSINSINAYAPIAVSN